MNIHETEEISWGLPMASKEMLDLPWMSENERYLSTIIQSCSPTDVLEAAEDRTVTHCRCHHHCVQCQGNGILHFIIV